MTSTEEILSRLEYLESKVAFQDDAIEAMSEEIARQQQLVDKQRVQIEFLVKKLKGMQGSMIASESEETPPPHY